jgi:hypothetical protein
MIWCCFEQVTCDSSFDDDSWFLRSVCMLMFLHELFVDPCCIWHGELISVGFSNFWNIFLEPGNSRWRSWRSSSSLHEDSYIFQFSYGFSWEFIRITYGFSNAMHARVLGFGCWNTIVWHLARLWFKYAHGSNPVECLFPIALHFSHIPSYFHALSISHFLFFHQLQKITINWKLIQLTSNFLHHDPHSVYFFVIIKMQVVPGLKNDLP